MSIINNIEHDIKDNGIGFISDIYINIMPNSYYKFGSINDENYLTFSGYVDYNNTKEILLKELDDNLFNLNLNNEEFEFLVNKENIIKNFNDMVSIVYEKDLLYKNKEFENFAYKIQLKDNMLPANLSNITIVSLFNENELNEKLINFSNFFKKFLLSYYMNLSIELFDNYITSEAEVSTINKISDYLISHNNIFTNDIKKQRDVDDIIKNATINYEIIDEIDI